MRLKALGSVRWSTSATRAPARPSMIAAVQPARLAPTMTASHSAAPPPLPLVPLTLLIVTSCGRLIDLPGQDRARSLSSVRAVTIVRPVVRVVLYTSHYECQPLLEDFPRPLSRPSRRR